MTTGFSLLDFILNLLKNPQAQQDFQNNPHQVLQQHGFDGLCAQDVHDALPLVVDKVQASFPRDYDGGTSTAGTHTAPPTTTLPGETTLDAAIRQLQHVTNNYSYSDSHNTVLDNSVNQNIWANGDVHQSFDNDPTVASGTGAVAAGHDIKGNVATGDHNVAGNGNTVAVGDGDATGSADDNSTHTTVSGFGSGNVAVGNQGTTVLTDTHNTTDAHNTTDSHNSSTDSHDTVASGNTDSHNTTDSHNHNTADSHNSDAHNTTDSHDAESTQVHGDSQHGLVNVDHVLNDNSILNDNSVDLLHHHTTDPHETGDPFHHGESTEIHGDSQHGLVNVDHVLNDNSILNDNSVDLLHNLHL
jgi:hypothetical protein